MDAVKTTHGGPGRGQGRHKSDNKRERISVRILPELIAAMRNSGLSDREFIEIAIRSKISSGESIDC